MATYANSAIGFIAYVKVGAFDMKMAEIGWEDFPE